MALSSGPNSGPIRPGATPPPQPGGTLTGAASAGGYPPELGPPPFPSGQFRGLFGGTGQRTQGGSG